MKRTLTAFALVGLLHVGLSAPWRLMVLAGEALTVTPGMQRLTQDDSLYWKAIDLQERLEQARYTVEYSRLLPAYYGLTLYDKHAIFVEESLHWNDRYRVLLHEAAHAYHPAWLGGSATGEIYAESVAALVCDCGYRESARYLATARGSLPVMLFYSGDIYRGAAFLR